MLPYDGNVGRHRSQLHEGGGGGGGVGGRGFDNSFSLTPLDKHWLPMLGLLSQ